MGLRVASFGARSHGEENRSDQAGRGATLTHNVNNTNISSPADLLVEHPTSGWSAVSVSSRLSPTKKADTFPRICLPNTIGTDTAMAQPSGHRGLGYLRQRSHGHAAILCGSHE